MPGRAPKHPSVRQRTNRTMHATLHILQPGEIQIPELPARFDKEGNEVPWEIRTLEWWEAIWSSPMAPEFQKSDIEGLYNLALLKQQFWKYGDPRVHGEIRLYETQFGLNPMARRRLEWQIEDTEEKQEAHEKRRAADTTKPSVRRPGQNPYGALG